MRVIIPIIVSALLTTACGTDATGECRGTHLGASVNWPIDGEASRWERDSDRILLHHSPNGNAGLTRFGVDIWLVDGAVVGGGPVTVALSNEHALRLVPAADSLVVDWLVSVATRSTTGFPETTGVPVAGSVTFDAVNEDFAAGRYVYRYMDGSELTCTFNVPSPERAAGFWGGDYDDDDDDD
ncbi:hypothetical protein HV824_30535 [Myxococcus sp. AM009]|nr:hypothetical protein [Myxococcus sp. AM009]NVJ18353.1 hypothetical protein [Myxococcus sp. AM010]